MRFTWTTALLLLCMVSLAQENVEDFGSVAETGKQDQEESEAAAPNPYRFALKVVPFSMIDPSMPSLQVAGEWCVSAYRSLNLDIGVQPGATFLSMGYRKNSKGLKGRFQYRSYARHRSFRGFYTGFEGFYKYQQFDFEVVYGHDCNAFDGSCAFYEFADIAIEHHAWAAGMLIGLEPLARNRASSRFIFDVSTSLGIRWMREYYREIPDDVEVFDIDSIFASYRDFRSPRDYFYPNIGFTIRIGWWIS